MVISKAIRRDWSMGMTEMKYKNGRIYIRKEMLESLFCNPINSWRNPPQQNTLWRNMGHNYGASLGRIVGSKVCVRLK
jgi:hypothetical protein